MEPEFDPALSPGALVGSADVPPAFLFPSLMG